MSEHHQTLPDDCMVFDFVECCTGQMQELSRYMWPPMMAGTEEP